jgi:hypothetical protein
MEMAMKVLMALLLGVVLSGSSAPRAYYAGKARMIAQSEVIAVVDVRRVGSASARGRHWTYAQAADAVVEQTLKGELPPRVRLYAQEDFICARVDFRPGRYVVFLTRDGELLAGSNWYLSARPIRDDGRVEWYAGVRDSGPDPSQIRLRPAPLAAVLADVRSHLARPRARSGPSIRREG